MTSGPLLRLAVAAPLRGFYDYLPPVGVDPALLRPGMRLRLPFGRSERIGVILETGVSCAPELVDRIKPALALLDDAPLLDENDLALLRWAADYYHHPLGEVIAAALPLRLRQGRPVLEFRALVWRLTDQGRSRSRSELNRAPRQRAIVEQLNGGAQRSSEELQELLAGPPLGPVLKRLKQLGWIEQIELLGDPVDPRQVALGESGPELHQEQHRAVEAVIQGLGAFDCWLLDGITGSGKTEVYLRCAQAALAQGGQVLVLVPEIGLTPQLVSRFRRRIPVPTAVLHSGLPDSRREIEWQLARSGRARVLIGTRSAIFTPLPELALILVDEEHDLSYKQQEGFRYSARDLAVLRAQRARCPVLLGSATPSLESLHNVLRGRYQLLQLNQRAGGALPPLMELVDLRNKRIRGGLASSLQQLVRETLERGEQVLLFLNRRGYAPLMVCNSCGWFVQCPRCDARMTLHLAQHRLWCHHCDHQRAPQSHCPQCGTESIVPAGVGTERLERELAGLYPDHSIVRIDRDSTSRKGRFEALLEEIHAGRHGLLIGTQMLAKGHHFPAVTLVGILDVDQGFYGVDYHAMERMAQTILQVAGRAGRAERPGRVVIQTRHPEHPLLQRLIRQGYRAFARDALAERQEAELPPYSFQALLRAEANRAETAREFLNQLRSRIVAEPGNQVLVLGPVASPMERRAGRYRAQLLLQCDKRNPLQQVLADQLARIGEIPGASRVRWSVDVDPMEMG